MKKWVPLIVIGSIVLVVGLFFMGRYNGLVTSSNEVDNGWAEVENQLQRRTDLIGNLVETVKGYAAHEKEIFTQVADARAKMAGATTPSTAGPANDAMSSALSRLLVVAERYPDLKASEQFTGLRDELAGTENRITVARNRYNASVKEYNNATKRFPGNLVAGMFGFESKSYFEIAESAKQAPQVKF